MYVMSQPAARVEPAIRQEPRVIHPASLLPSSQQPRVRAVRVHRPELRGCANGWHANEDEKRAVSAPLRPEVPAEAQTAIGLAHEPEGKRCARGARVSPALDSGGELFHGPRLHVDRAYLRASTRKLRREDLTAMRFDISETATAPRNQPKSLRS